MSDPVAIESFDVPCDFADGETTHVPLSEEKAPASPSTVAALSPAALMDACITMTAALEKVSATVDWLTRRGMLVQQLLAARSSAAVVDHAQVAAIGVQLTAVMQESPEGRLSESELRELPARHAELVKAVEEACDKLEAEQNFALMFELSEHLTALQRFDLLSIRNLHGKPAVNSFCDRFGFFSTDIFSCTQNILIHQACNPTQRAALTTSTQHSPRCKSTYVVRQRA